MRKLQDKVAVVTGAGGGIGRAVGERLARKGCHLALVDIQESGLHETADSLRSAGRKVSIHLADVSNRSQMERLPDTVLQQRPGVHLLVNNAGVSLAGPFESYRIEDLEWIVGVNFWGVVYGCKFFLPALRREAEAHIVNIASDFGLIGMPTKTAYCATKFAVRGFSEALRAELHGSNVEVTCVYPGPVNTGLVRGGRASDAGKQQLEADFVAARGIPREKVADKIIRGIERDAPRILIGRETYAIDILTRFFPVLTNALLARFGRRMPFL